jgi:hypothetical protein
MSEQTMMQVRPLAEGFAWRILVGERPRAVVAAGWREDEELARQDAQRAWRGWLASNDDPGWG